MSVFRVNLADGRKVSVDSLEFSGAYAGLIEGGPSAELNAEYRSRHVEAIQERWGERATHVIEPTLQPLRSGMPPVRLPAVACAAWLESEAFDGQAMGSALVVIWWQDE